MCTYVLCYTVVELTFIFPGIWKLNFLGDMSPIDPPPAKIVHFFQTKSHKYLACSEKPYLITIFFCNVTSSLSTRFNEIFIKKGEKIIFFSFFFLYNEVDRRCIFSVLLDELMLLKCELILLIRY